MDPLLDREAEGVGDGGVEILRFVGFGLDVAGHLVGLADDLTSFDAAASHHDGKGLGEMIASATSVDPWSPAELGGQNHHGLVQHALGGEVLQEGSYGAVHGIGSVGCRPGIAMLAVPTAELDFDITHVVLDEATGQEETTGKPRVPIEILHAVRLLVDVEELGGLAVKELDGLFVKVGVGFHVVMREALCE